MTLKQSLHTGTARAVFAQPVGRALMARGAQIVFSPEDDGGAAPAEASAETPTAEAPEGGAAPEAGAEGETPAGEASAGETAPEEPKKPKSPVSQLQGRVGHLTKTLHEKDEALAEANRRTQALEALLAAAGKTPGADDPKPTPAPAATGPAPGTPEFQKLVLTEAEKVAAHNAFVADCNTIFDKGLEKHGESFKEGVANLNALGLMDPNLIQAAMATGAAPEVLNALGQDVDEAQRIASLPPARMGVELANLANKLSAPKDPKQISKVPAPITPVGSSSRAEPDVYDPNLSDADYIARRKQMGARWAQ